MTFKWTKRANWPTSAEVIEACNDRETSLSNPGFCLACGEPHEGCEPDARECECESCGEHAVYGAEECLLMETFR